MEKKIVDGSVIPPKEHWKHKRDDAYSFECKECRKELLYLLGKEVTT